MKGNESFLEKEMKFARKWLYSKNIMVPTEAQKSGHCFARKLLQRLQSR